jgi:hypothetical protein
LSILALRIHHGQVPVRCTSSRCAGLDTTGPHPIRLLQCERFSLRQVMAILIVSLLLRAVPATVQNIGRSVFANRFFAAPLL